MSWRVINEVPGQVIVEMDHDDGTTTTAGLSPDQAEAMGTALWQMAAKARTQ